MQLDADLFPYAILHVDVDGRIRDANGLASEMLGLSAALLDADLVELLVPRNSLGQPLWVDGQIVLPKVERTVVFRHVAGHDVSTITSVIPLSDGSTSIAARLPGTVDEATLISVVSHELRSPLTAIKGYVSLLLGRWDDLDDGTRWDMLEQVHRDADRVARMVTELLDINRLESGQLELHRRIVDVAALTARVVDQVSMSHPDLDCTVDVEAGTRAYVDPDKIGQVITNLVENAAKYGDPEGIRIDGGTTADPAGGPGQVAISISDRGPGIADEDLSRVFEKFFRREQGRPSGTGLGLWISRGLVQAHGGALTVVSAPGKGTTFTFTLPLGEFEAAHGP